jgi:hypothetical protein
VYAVNAVIFHYLSRAHALSLSQTFLGGGGGGGGGGP